MSKLTIGIIKEGKVPPDRRVPLTPSQAKEIMSSFPQCKVLCQRSDIRSYKDGEYAAEGIQVVDDLSDCDVLLGIKEVPIINLIPDKTYFFFSHTMKKQPYNKKLLQAVLKNNITLVDYEALTDDRGNRLVAFGRYAGVVGAYNALWAFGKRHHLYTLRRAHECFDMDDLKNELKKVKLPPVKIVITGKGRVGKGCIEILESVNIKPVNTKSFLNKKFDYPVYTILSSADYHLHKDGKPYEREEFHSHPQRYTSDFLKYALEADILLAGAYWNPSAPALFTSSDMRNHRFKIKVIADITCDINGSIPSTKKSSTVDDPLYDYNPFTEQVEKPLSDDKNLTVMAVDNLPCELPRSASADFGRDLLDRVIPHLISGDKEGIIARATIASHGKLTDHFSYLHEYVSD